ncbi:hypothetical protein Tco_1078728 [Tanacetum coccineum]|uniref:Retrotransposon gag domain-containing protein n=1 Tax=Tanacetum coccineum TaxID=301880 RepID=A0ABQ5HPT7_9ASTR
MGWVVCSNAVVESCDAVLIFVVTSSRCICDAVSSHYREILEQCWCRNYGRSRRQYSHHGIILSIVTRNLAPGVVKPKIGGNVNFKIKSQLMRELREDTFFGNKDEDAHDHIDWVLSIVGLFNIPEVSKDAVMLRVFPFTLTVAVKRWVDRLAPGTINTWDLLKSAFIQRNMVQTRQPNNPPDVAEIIAQQLQKIIPNIVTQVTNNLNNGNGNGNGGGNNGCTYKGFVACGPRDFDRTGGEVALTRWIEKMESVINNSGCLANQMVKYAVSSFIGKALTWWNTQVEARGRDAANAMAWNDFKALLTTKFCPSNEIEKLEGEF